MSSENVEIKLQEQKKIEQGKSEVVRILAELLGGEGNKSRELSINGIFRNPDPNTGEGPEFYGSAPGNPSKFGYGIRPEGLPKDGKITVSFAEEPHKVKLGVDEFSVQPPAGGSYFPHTIDTNSPNDLIANRPTSFFTEALLSVPEIQKITIEIIEKQMPSDQYSEYLKTQVKKACGIKI